MAKKEKVTVIGAGLSGPLLAVLLARRGYAVSLYERRPDMRLTQISAGRSINLALSDRGIAPLRKIGLGRDILSETVAMHGRMIHDISGATNMQPYSGRKGEHINSVSRGGLNMKLMDEAARNNIPIYFEHRCINADLETGTTVFINEATGEEVQVKADVVIGTDGAGSAVRNAMLEHSGRLRFSFSQEYLEHG
ncbi:MAG: FAD-dependent monooxygenase, partial [Sinomicrobium sp.]|nr:FAD-dependent monooxygenase [Sinomicrobium sp.]